MTRLFKTHRSVSLSLLSFMSPRPWNLMTSSYLVLFSLTSMLKSLIRMVTCLSLGISLGWTGAYCRTDLWSPSHCYLLVHSTGWCWGWLSWYRRLLWWSFVHGFPILWVLSALFGQHQCYSLCVSSIVLLMSRIQQHLLWQVFSVLTVSIGSHWYLAGWACSFSATLCCHWYCLPCFIHCPHIPYSDVDCPGWEKGCQPCSFQRLLAFTTVHHKSFRRRPISSLGWVV